MKYICCMNAKRPAPIEALQAVGYDKGDMQGFRHNEMDIGTLSTQFNITKSSSALRGHAKFSVLVRLGEDVL